MEISNNVPVGWEYRTVLVDQDYEFVYNRRYHIYHDYWIAQMWNGIRTVRVILNEQIRNCLLKGFAAKPPLFTKPEHTAQFQISTDTLYKMQSDILASVPQHLAITPRPTPYASVAPRTLDRTLTLFPWTNFNESNAESFSMVRASGPYFLMWPLWLTGVMDVVTEEVRQFAAKNLRHIAETMGSK